MLSPRYPAAVVAGNVETTQHVTDCLFGALGALASAQGTMNNLTFGNATLPVLRDDLLGRAGGRLQRRHRLRRRRRGPHPHDQLAPDRPGGARVALPGAARGFPHPRRAPAAGDAGRPATARRAPSASSRRWTAPSSPRTAACRRTASSAAAIGAARHDRGPPRSTARIETLQGCDQTVLKPGEAVIVTTPTGGGYGKPGAR